MPGRWTGVLAFSDRCAESERALEEGQVTMFCDECRSLIEQMELAGRTLTAAAIRNLHGLETDLPAREQMLLDAMEQNDNVCAAFEAHRKHCYLRSLAGAA